MAQNITIMGASYSDVPAVELPKTGGGTALFADPAITTALVSDVASGKQFLLADGSIGTGTASGGGGGASNVVTGTFKGTTTGAAMNITLPYTGTGYPVAISIYPSSGYQADTSPYDVLQRYAVMFFSGAKVTATAPTYQTGGVENQFAEITAYKSSATVAPNLGTSATTTMTVLRGADASSTLTSDVRFLDSKTLSVFIASTSYGFMANIEYTYWVIYSS